MNTAEQIRREQWAGYYRLRQQQEILVREYLVPLARLAGERIRETHPEIFPEEKSGELDYCAVCDGNGFYDDPRVPCQYCDGSGLKRY